MTDDIDLFKVVRMVCRGVETDQALLFHGSTFLDLYRVLHLYGFQVRIVPAFS